MLYAAITILTALSVFNFSPDLIEKKAYQRTPPPIEIEGLSIAGLIPSEHLQQQMENKAIKKMFRHQDVDLSLAAQSYVISAMRCVKNKNIEHKPILSIIDYSKPSSAKRLWVFDLENKKLLYNTHVSHGIKTGGLHSNRFSNVHNSKTSSIGVFLTKQSYYGRHGIAMRLRGLESGFNDHAGGRAIVMHGGWYMEEPFINKYGRPGRSWGCPAVPKTLAKKIINTIKNDTLLIGYYPSETWFISSRYLNCNNLSYSPKKETIQTEMMPYEENRSPILFVEKNNNNRWDRFEPVVVIKACDYMKRFNHNVPIKRMLRRQINNHEYVALNQSELEQILQTPKNNADLASTGIEEVQFVVPHIKSHRGRYLGTEMKIISLGDIDAIKRPELDSANLSQANFSVHFKKNATLKIQSTDQFIRWLGL